VHDLQVIIPNPTTKPIPSLYDLSNATIGTKLEKKNKIKKNKKKGDEEEEEELIEGFRSIENKKFPTITNKNSQDLIYEMQNNERERLDLHERGRRSRTSVSYSGSDPIQAPQRAAPPSVAHVQRNDDSSSSVQRDAVEW
jgi:hypothetical protein